jgi:hypothetical protein
MQAEHSPVYALDLQWVGCHEGQILGQMGVAVQAGRAS